MSYLYQRPSRIFSSQRTRPQRYKPFQPASEAVVWRNDRFRNVFVFIYHALYLSLPFCDGKLTYEFTNNAGLQ